MKPVFKELFLGKKEITIQGNIVYPDGVRQGTISFSKGKGMITGVDDERIGKEPDVILENGYLFPGFVDLHVHAREDSSQQWTYKENYISAAKAALAGGVTAFADMPNTPEPAVDDQRYDKKVRLSRFSGMEVLPYAGIGPGTEPLSMNVPYKVFMAKSVGELCFGNEKELRITLEKYEGLNVSFHCEDPEVLGEHENDKSHRDRRPPEAEIRAVELAFELIEENGIKGKLCHISTKGSLDLIERKRRKSGVSVTVEATPHHLLLEDNGNGIEFPDCLRPLNDDGEGNSHSDDESKRESGGMSNRPSERVPDSFFQVNPPIRGHEDRMTLLEAFKEGRIDFLATDHAPHTREEKMQGMSGLPSLDSFGGTVGCLLESGVRAEIVARAAAYRPGEFISEFGLSSRKLEVGEVVHLCHLVKGGEEVTGGGGFSKAGWNPFEGFNMPWSVGFTILRGRGWKKTQSTEPEIGGWKRA